MLTRVDCGGIQPDLVGTKKRKGISLIARAVIEAVAVLDGLLARFESGATHAK